ncbi:MAG: SDR family NAD(P)-dependent oxidoreductase, partial [Rhizobiales bacterium]|nr:SDR family NAD(P)-dependent oxidoreductase [Hyphomicrobiales bacterium]
MTDTRDLRTALVTGAGGGMGREIARQLRDRGIRVALADLDAAGLAETAAEGEGVLHLAGDLTRDGAADEAVEAVLARWGRIDALVNNASYGVIEPF